MDRWGIVMEAPPIVIMFSNKLVHDSIVMAFLLGTVATVRTYARKHLHMHRSPKMHPKAIVTSNLPHRNGIIVCCSPNRIVDPKQTNNALNHTVDLKLAIDANAVGVAKGLEAIAFLNLLPRICECPSQGSGSRSSTYKQIKIDVGRCSKRQRTNACLLTNKTSKHH